MNQNRRGDAETPRMETRSFTDDQGRRWSGSVISGRFGGGEEHAEVIFVCEDTPSETKRSTRLDSAPVDAAEEWRGMGEAQVRTLFLRSEPA